MSFPLAVCVPVIGQVSETFLRRHVEDLLPDGTVVIARREAAADDRAWRAPGPMLLLDQLGDEWGGSRERAAVCEFLRSHGVRSVLTEYLDIWLPFGETFADMGLTRVAHAHGYDVSMRLRESYWRGEYLAYGDFDAVVVMSEHARVRLAGLAGLSPDRLAVVHYGVDLPDVDDRHPDVGAVHVLLAGRLVAKKDPVASLSACARAASAGADLHVTVIGDGPLMPAVEEAARTVGAPVRLLGARPHHEVLQAMRTADIFCQHSVVDAATGDEEGMPVAILEAMAHGLPIVSTRHAGIPEAVEDGVTGLLVDEGDVGAMAECITALAADAAVRRRLGAAGRKRVAEHMSWRAERRAMLDLLRLTEVAGCGNG